MKSFSLIVISFLIIQIGKSQSLTYDWHFTAGNMEADLILDHAIDDQNNIIIVGQFAENLYLGVETYQANNTANSGFVAKLDAQGALLWSKEIAADDFSEVLPYAVEVAQDGSIFAAGSFLGQIDADPSSEEFILQSERDDIYLSKFDKNGHLIWAQAIRGSASQENILDMHIDDQGMIYLGGYIDASATGNDDEILLLKVNPIDTAIEWTYAINTAGRLDGIDAVKTFGDHIYITGTFEGSVDFDASEQEWILEGGEERNMFVAKLTKNAGLVWAIQVGGVTDGQADGESLALDNDGNIYVVGSFHREVDFDPGEGSAVLDGFFSTYLLKLNNEGNFIWGQHTDGITSQTILVDDNDAVILGIEVGQTLDLRQFDPMGNVTDNSEMKVVGSSLVSLRNLAFDNNGDMVLTASFADSINFDPNSDEYIVSQDSWDFTVIKLKRDQATSLRTLGPDWSIDVFPNPVIERLHIQLNGTPSKMQVEIIDAAGRLLDAMEFSNESAISLPFPYLPGNYYIKLRGPKQNQAIVKVSKI